MTAAETTAGRLSVLPTDALTAHVPAAEEIRTIISSMYDVDTLQYRAGDELFVMLRVRDTNGLLEKVSPEQFAVDERLPYWADLWTSSIDMAAWLLEERQYLAGKSVLELGSGIGLAGIAAARAGARVTITDYETDPLLFACYNAMQNLPPDVFRERVRFLPLDWREPGVDTKFDLIVGADIVYERKNFLPVLSLLKNHLLPGGRALLTEPDRTIGQDFLDLARAQQFSVDRAYSTLERDGRLYRISRNLLKIE